RHPRERRGDHLVARADAGELEADLERGGAGIQRAHGPPAAQLRQRRLERLHLRPRRDPARAQHLGDARDRLLVDRRPRERQEAHAAPLRVTSTTPATMKPMPISFCAVSDSPNRYHAATALMT